jgi:hypothetical protein
MNVPMNVENELPEEKKENKNEKEENIITEETFENINSPQLIQNILHLSTNSSKIGLDLENNIIKSLISINNLIAPLLLDNKNEENDIDTNSNFNPFLHTLNKKNELCKLNFEELNVKNKFLNKKIKQYNELKQKISDFKNDKNKELSDKEKMYQKLFLVQNPLITIFEDEINVKEIKNELHKEYLNKMENHTEYKYTEPRNLLLGNINLNNFLHFNDEEEENREIDDQNDDEEDSNNENEEDEGSFVDEVYNGEMEVMVDLGNDNNNNNNIGVVEVPIQAENIQQQNENIHIENAELPNQVENVQVPNENNHIENAELPNQEQPNENNNLIDDNNNEDNNQHNDNEEP